MVWVAGAALTAAQLNLHAPQALTAYTPTWTGSGSNPAIGNGTITGRYQRSGQWVTGWFKITMGSTTTYGSGNWIVGLPLAPHASLPDVAIGTAHALNTGVQNYGRILIVGGAANVTAIGETGGVVTAASPFSWGAGDVFGGTFAYETAA